LDDDVIDGSHHEADLHGVGCASEMGINLLGLMLVERDKSVEDVIACGLVISTAFVVWEVVLHRAHRELFLETIDLVEEEDDGSLDKPSRIADGVEQGKGFLHTVDSLILEEKLVVFGDGDEEEDCSNVFEAMDPFLTFRSLATNIEHAVCEVSDDKGGFGDTSSLDTRSEDILVVGDVIGSSYAIDGIKVVFG